MVLDFHPECFGSGCHFLGTYQLTGLREYVSLTLPIPPIPRIPRTFFWGSWPSVVFPCHWPVIVNLILRFIKNKRKKKKKKGEIPARKAANGTYACRKAPIIKKMPTSAVAWLTATGVLETAIPGRVSIIQHVADRDLNDVPFLVQAAMSTLS